MNVESLNNEIERDLTFNNYFVKMYLVSTIFENVPLSSATTAF